MLANRCMVFCHYMVPWDIVGQTHATFLREKLNFDRFTCYYFLLPSYFFFLFRLLERKLREDVKLAVIPAVFHRSNDKKTKNDAFLSS